MPQGNQSHSATCQCGQTVLELTGKPIESVACYCRSCRKAARQFEQAPGAPRIVNAHGGVDYCLYRKDRVRIAQGGEHLQEHRLKPDSPTRRVVAKCCGSPIFVEFTRGHWLTLYRGRLPQGGPAPVLSAMTKYREEGTQPPADIPAYETIPPRLMIKLIAAWAAMGFRRPKITW